MVWGGGQRGRCGGEEEKKRKKTGTGGGEKVWQHKIN